MDNARVVLGVCMHNLRKWVTNPRIYIIFIIQAILNNFLIAPISEFSGIVGYRTAPYIFPFLSSNVVCQLILMTGVIFLFCDAPFIDDGQPYLLIRCGRTRWAIGQVLYIMSASALYFLIIIILGIVMLIPNVAFINDWGKVLTTLAQTDIGYKYQIYLPVSASIQSNYSPLQALFISYVLEWSVGTMIGLIMFIFNMYFKRTLGAVIASIITIFDFAIHSNMPHTLFFFSPVSLARLEVLDPRKISNNPANAYAYVFFAVVITVLSIISVLSMKKKEIHVLPPV